MPKKMALFLYVGSCIATAFFLGSFDNFRLILYKESQDLYYCVIIRGISKAESMQRGEICILAGFESDIFGYPMCTI